MYIHPHTQIKLANERIESSIQEARQYRMLKQSQASRYEFRVPFQIKAQSIKKLFVQGQHLMNKLHRREAKKVERMEPC